MSEMLEKYKSFVHHMWINNCDERQQWSQPVLTKDEYERQNGTFLEDSFWMQETGAKVWNGNSRSVKYAIEK